MVMGPLGRPRPGNGGAGGSGAPGQAGEWDSDDRLPACHVAVFAVAR